MVRQRIFLPSTGAADWQRLLAEPEKQWRTGYSARTLAHCWEAFDDLPPEIAAFFPGEPELLMALPEYKVPLPGGRRESQSDVFALVRCGDLMSALMIEGKVEEPFGPTVADWSAGASKGKHERLEHICSLLGLSLPLPSGIRYQLLHRTAAAAIEATRFNADEAAMFVHSFSKKQAWHADFEAFCSLMHCERQSNGSYRTMLQSGQPLRLGWAQGDERFLAC
jgi:hypothetical protein